MPAASPPRCSPVRSLSSRRAPARCWSKATRARPRRHDCRHPRRVPAQGPPARRHHAGRRPRHCGLHQPRSVQIGARRGGPQRLPGQDHRAAARAEDRCQDGDPRVAAVGNGRGRQQTRARDFRRRRAVRPRRDLGRARRGSVVLPQGARHPGEGGGGASDPGLRRRGGGRDRARRAARRADGSRRGLARSARMMMHPAVTNGAYDVARIREDFPILAMQVYGKPLVYLDNAASAQKPKAVLDRLNHAYTAEYANVHRGLHFLANAATEAYEDAREKVRAFLNAARKEEIIFTRNATEAINLVAYTFGRERIKAGDEIVLSIMEHHSNVVPWHFLRERQGAVIKWAPVDDEGNFLLDEFEKLLSPRTKMVALSHMSNMLGTLVPVKEVVRRAHARGIPVLLDGAQAAVHLDVDVQDIGCDFYAVTGHKLYGP